LWVKVTSKGAACQVCGKDWFSENTINSLKTFV